MNAKAKRILEEERESLLSSEECFEKFHRNSYPVFETAIAKGAANHVGKWPSHLFAAFLAASLVFAVFVLFALVMALFCVPVSYSCRNSRNLEFTEFPNVYYVKVSNYSWRRDELCYIESSARDNPEINIYLINILMENPEEKSLSTATTMKNERNGKDLTNMLVLREQANNSIDNIVYLSSNATTETRIRKRLAAHYANVRNIDVSIDDFFRGSMLVHESRKLGMKTLETAARAYLLWNASGVALTPSEYRRLGYLREYLCKSECKTIKFATIDPAGSLLASGVPCQAFVGYLIHEIALNGISASRDVVKAARESFCKREDCPGLKVLKEDSTYPSIAPACPTIYPSGYPGKSRSTKKLEKLTEADFTNKRKNRRDAEEIKLGREIFI